MNHLKTSKLTGRALVREWQQTVQERGVLTLVAGPPSSQRDTAIIELAKQAGLREIPAHIKPEDHKNYAVTYLFYELETGFWIFETATGMIVNDVALLPVPAGAYETLTV